MHIEFFAVWWTLLVAAVPFYWLIPGRFSGFRFVIPVSISITLIALLSVQLIIIVLAYNCFVAGLLAAFRHGVKKNTIRRLSWASFLLLFGFRFLPEGFVSAGLLSGELFTPNQSNTLVMLSTSYLALRAFIVLRESITRSPPSIRAVLTTLVFGGSFLFGPVVGASPWMERSERLSWRDVGRALYRIFIGVLMIVFLEPVIRGFDFIWVFDLPTDPTFRAWLGIYTGYITFYLIFAGYTSVAIGIGLLYGVNLPENFNYPFLATSIKDFWRRWHISLANFVKKYLFLPVVRKTGNPYLGLIAAFLAVGIWHAQSAPYIIWGIGHGVALAINLYISRSFDFTDSRFRYLLPVVGWCFTFTYVGVLSKLAKQDTLSDVADTSMVLLGLMP